MFDFGVVALAPRIDPHALDEIDRGRNVVVLHQAAIHDVVVVHRAPQDKVTFLGNLAGVAGRQEQVLAALALVGAGQAEVGDRALPEVIDQTDTRPGRDLEDDRPLAEIDVHHAVDRGVVGGEPDALGVGEVVRDDQIVEVGAQVPLHPDADGLERNGRKGPQEGLDGALVVHLVVQFSRGFLGRKSSLEVQRADACLHAVGRLGVRARDGQRAGDSDCDEACV